MKGGTVGTMSLMKVQRVEIPARRMQESLDALREYGQRNLERFVFWAGIVGDGTARVEEVIIPDQDSHTTADGCWVDIATPVIQKMQVRAVMTGLTLFAQVHSHPNLAFHSERDNELSAVKLPGSLSVVVPFLGRRPFRTFADFACFRLASSGVWAPLSSADAGQLFVVVNDHG